VSFTYSTKPAGVRPLKEHPVKVPLPINPGSTSEIEGSIERHVKQEPRCADQGIIRVTGTITSPDVLTLP
jgi:hypothetical protein